MTQMGGASRRKKLSTKELPPNTFYKEAIQEIYMVKWAGPCYGEQGDLVTASRVSFTYLLPIKIIPPLLEKIKLPFSQF